MQRNLSQEGPPMHQSPHMDRTGVPLMSKERPLTTQPPIAPYKPGPPVEESNLLRRNLLGQDPTTEGARRDYTSPKKEYDPTPARTGFRGQYYNHQPTSAPATEAPRSHPHTFDPSRRPLEQYPPQEGQQNYRPPMYDPERRRDDSTPSGVDPRAPLEPLSRRQSGEEMQPSRSFLGINSDPNKRGRASPLPQAVKGAQAQYVGPGSDPGIKSEFGRIFQGLGSGLGGPGSMTPSRQSPVPQRVRDDMALGGLDDNEGIKMARVGSKGPRLVRRGKDDEDGRQTPVGSGARGGKRSKQP
jgi:hypothetical protein